MWPSGAKRAPVRNPRRNVRVVRFGGGVSRSLPFLNAAAGEKRQGGEAATPSAAAASIARDSRSRRGAGGSTPEAEIPEEWSRIAARSRARSFVEPYRSSGSLARHRSTIQTRFVGVFGAARRIGSGSASMIAESVCAGVGRSKARRPDAIS